MENRSEPVIHEPAAPPRGEARAAALSVLQTQPPRRQVAWVDLGVEEYDRAYQFQLHLHGLRVAGDIPDTVIVVEHSPCITVRRPADREHILAGPEELRAAGVSVHATTRGGDVTYHGPGQLVLYPIVHLDGYGRDLHAYARRLEQVLIDTVAAFGVEATRRKEYPGVWTAAGKIGAIGLSVRRWVALHGVSLNVAPEMSHFSMIVPCGIRDEGVASLSQLVGKPVELAAAKKAVWQAFEQVFAVGLNAVPRENLAPTGHRSTDR